MNNPNLFLQSALGRISPEVVDAATSGSVLRPTGAMTCLDNDGNPLIVNGVYEHPMRGKIQVLREEFGSGNCMDTYYRVFYRGQDFKESWFVVDASWTKEGRVYRSRLVKVEEEQL